MVVWKCQRRNSTKLCTLELWWFKQYFVLTAHGGCTVANARRPFFCRHTFGCILLARNSRSVASLRTSNSATKLPRAFKPRSVADRRRLRSHASSQPHLFCSVQSAHRKPGDEFTICSASNDAKRNSVLKQGLPHASVDIRRGERTSVSKLRFVRYKRIRAGCFVVPGLRVRSRVAGQPEASSALFAEVCPANANSVSTPLLRSKRKCGGWLHSMSTREQEKRQCRYKHSGEATWLA